ncbi:MAG: hypothetical protein CMJ75_18775 [Planctomycetaceae bacterium]|nr:hypothetical protein [Planctomycetaceae bacterium]
MEASPLKVIHYDDHDLTTQRALRVKVSHAMDDPKLNWTFYYNLQLFALINGRWYRIDAWDTDRGVAYSSGLPINDPQMLEAWSLEIGGKQLYHHTRRVRAVGAK